MYKLVNGIPADITIEIFWFRKINQYNLRCLSHFVVPPVHSTCNGTWSTACLGPKIWSHQKSKTYTL